MRMLPVLILCLISASLPAFQATRPAQDVQRLILQLGDEDFRKREAAQEQLVGMGAEILPALREARKIEDPEIQSRLDQVIRRLEQRPIPGGPLKAGPGHRITAHTLNADILPDGCVVTVQESGRRITITKRANGVIVTVSAVINGKLISETYQAANAAQLRTENPEVYQIFARWGGGDGPDYDHTKVSRTVDPVDAFQNLLEDRMDELNLPLAQRNELLGLMHKISMAMARGFDETDQQREARLKELFAHADAFHEKLSELGLPDPGEALPPPAKARLGIQLVAQNELLQVEKVVAGQRGEKIGLKAGDIISKVNDREVKTLGQLRQALVESKGPLTIEGLRNDQPLKLAEK